MKRLYRYAGLVLALGAVMYLAYYLYGSFDPSALRRLATPPTLAAMLAASLLYGSIIPASAWAWRRLLAQDSDAWPVGLLMGIMGVTQVAKYLPGNIAQHAGRAAISLSRGMGLGRFIVSTFAETALALFSALLVGSACLIFSSTERSLLTAHTVWPALGTVAVFGLLLPLLPRLLDLFSRLLAKMARRDPNEWRTTMPGVRAQIGAFCAYSLNYLLIGAGFMLVARAVGLGQEVGYAQITAAFALSWLAGFLAPGMPAGLGVREGVMLLILGSSDSDAAVLAVIAMRACTIVMDIGWFFLGGTLMTAFKDGRRV